MLSLRARPSTPAHGTIVVALEHGIVQLFSNHNLGGFIDSFHAIHMAGDCVISMVSDEANRYLITATALGYIKTWLICNFCVPASEMVHINMPALRLEFPFLIRTLFEGRAKRTVRNQTEPKLCNSYKAHTRPITCIEYLSESKLIMRYDFFLYEYNFFFFDKFSSASSDKTARIWTLGGRYIGTLGSPLKWPIMKPSEPVPGNFPFRIPPDIKRNASSTTLRVRRHISFEFVFFINV